MQDMQYQHAARRIVATVAIVVLMGALRAIAAPPATDAFVAEEAMGQRLEGATPTNSAPVAPPVPKIHLEIGPIDGLTTGWHRAPETTSIPVGAEFLVRIRVSADVPVQWHGAAPTSRTAQAAYALCSCEALGSESVSVSAMMAGTEVTDAMMMNVEPVAAADVTVSDVHVDLTPFEIPPGLDQASHNKWTVNTYFRTPSIAPVREIVPGEYVTSVRRLVGLSVDVTPAGFAPLVEWRLNGTPVALGDDVQGLFPTVGEHVMTAGMQGTADVRVTAYRTTMTSHTILGAGLPGGQYLPEYEPITFTAVTDPPGYENEINWLASTKYGFAIPATGTGPSFTTIFIDTSGPYEDGDEPFWSWIGVRANELALGQDTKGEGACCLDDGRCIPLLLPVDCANAGGVYQGPGADCSTPCVGACCLPDGSCQELSQLMCNDAAGVYQGNGALCADATCSGACCLPDGSCIETGPSGCSASGGDYRGDGTLCADFACVGACCLPDGNCMETSSVTCASLSGTYRGDGTLCADVACVGACCLSAGACVETTEAGCADLGGAYEGDGTDCSSVVCPVEPAFIGLEAVLVDPVAEGWDVLGYDDAALDTYRVYALFTGDSGVITAIGDVGDLFELLSGDGAFVNAAEFDSDFAPSPAAVGLAPEVQWDTFVTIGETVATGSGGTPVTQGAPGLIDQLDGIVGNTFLDCTGWFVSGFPTVGDAVDGRVLVAQFTVADGVDVAGVTWFVAGLTVAGDASTLFDTLASFPEALGACCLPDANCVDDVSIGTCLNFGGVFQGGDTTCADAVCAGACCLLDGSCTDGLSQEDCVGLGGAYQGIGSLCEDATCLGACCLVDGSCMDGVSPSACGGLGGVYQGDASECASVVCPVELGACCLPDTSCMPVLTGDECSSIGGFFQGIGSDCGSVVCVTNPGFVGLESVLVDPAAEGWDLLGYDASMLDTYRVYATFTDNSSLLIGVGDSDDLFELRSSDGAFVNASQFDSDFAPSVAAAVVAPEVRWDTFVTIGETVGADTDGSPLTQGAPGFIGQAAGLVGDTFLDDTGWFVFGFPSVGNPVDGRVLVAQLTVAEGIAVSGVNWRVSGLAVAGNPLTAFNILASFGSGPIGVSAPPSAGLISSRCATDMNADGVIDALDHSLMLDCWGTDHPIADANGSGHVGLADLMALLAAWGTCDDPCGADIDADGTVGVLDQLMIFEAWGTGDAGADLDANGVVDYGDLSRLLLAWGACE